MQVVGAPHRVGGQIQVVGPTPAGHARPLVGHHRHHAQRLAGHRRVGQCQRHGAQVRHVRHGQRQSVVGFAGFVEAVVVVGPQEQVLRPGRPDRHGERVGARVAAARPHRPGLAEGRQIRVVGFPRRVGGPIPPVAPTAQRRAVALVRHHRRHAQSSPAYHRADVASEGQQVRRCEAHRHGQFVVGVGEFIERIVPVPPENQVIRPARPVGQRHVVGAPVTQPIGHRRALRVIGQLQVVGAPHRVGGQIHVIRPTARRHACALVGHHAHHAQSLAGHRRVGQFHRHRPQVRHVGHRQRQEVVDLLAFVNRVVAIQVHNQVLRAFRPSGDTQSVGAGIAASGGNGSALGGSGEKGDIRAPHPVRRPIPAVTPTA